jgi:hypothetical protein
MPAGRDAKDAKIFAFLFVLLRFRGRRRKQLSGVGIKLLLYFCVLKPNKKVQLRTNQIL